jgi:glycosyltransferase involved in cell wall biosynthesis
VVVAHSCVLSWWQAVKGKAASAEWRRYRATVCEGLGGADAIVAPSAAMLNSLVQFYGPVANGEVIHNGCDSRPFRSRTKESFIFSAGRVWDEAKNISALGEIAHRLAWPVYVAGETKAPDCASEANPGAPLNCLGKLSRTELADWYSRASIYALPARYEPFGLSILEAAISGCALVIGEIPSLQELWQDAALFVSPNDPEHLKFAINNLFENPQKRSALANAACRRALEYDADGMSGQYLDLYHRLLLCRTPQTKELVPCA